MPEVQTESIGFLKGYYTNAESIGEARTHYLDPPLYLSPNVHYLDHTFGSSHNDHLVVVEHGAGGVVISQRAVQPVVPFEVDIDQIELFASLEQ
jgi:hypothetical protein